MFFNFLKFISFLFCNTEMKTGFYTDIGPVCPTGMSPISRRAGTREMVDYSSEPNEELGYLEENLQRLNIGIPDVTTDDLPRHYQCQMEGVSG